MSANDNIVNIKNKEIVADIQEDDYSELLIKMLDKINRKTDSVVKKLFEQGIFDKKKFDELDKYRLSGHKAMKKRLKMITETIEDKKDV